MGACVVLSTRKIGGKSQSFELYLLVDIPPLNASSAPHRKAGMTPDFYEDLAGRGATSAGVGQEGNVEIAYEKA